VFIYIVQLKVGDLCPDNNGVRCTLNSQVTWNKIHCLAIIQKWQWQVHEQVVICLAQSLEEAFFFFLSSVIYKVIEMLGNNQA